MAKHWNHHLATPKVPLRIKLENGRTVKGIRPGYISSREAGNQGYRTIKGKIINNVKGCIYDV